MCFSKSSLTFVHCPDAQCNALIEVVQGILKSCWELDCSGRVVHRTLVDEHAWCGGGFGLLSGVEEISCYAEEMCELHDLDEVLREECFDQREEQGDFPHTTAMGHACFTDDYIGHCDVEGQGRIIRELTADEDETYQAIEESGRPRAAHDWLMELS